MDAAVTETRCYLQRVSGAVESKITKHPAPFRSVALASAAFVAETPGYGLRMHRVRESGQIHAITTNNPEISTKKSLIFL